MKELKKPEPEDPFETAWRAWLDRPVRKQPEPAWLERRILRVRRRRQRIWLPLAAAAALASALGIAVFFRHKEALAPGPLASVTAVSPTLGQGEVLLWLDEQTPLYMTFQAPE